MTVQASSDLLKPQLTNAEKFWVESAREFVARGAAVPVEVARLLLAVVDRAAS